MNLEGKHVVVTGGSQGIGAEIARQVAAAGANVLVVSRSAPRLAEVADEIGGEWLTADLSVAADVDSLVRRCLERMGRIDVWINNAGHETSDAFTATPRADLRDVARLNFETPLMLTRDIVPHMLARGSGHIVQMGSVAGAVPFPGLAAYAGTKAGLTNFTETLRLELKGTGIGLTVVSPGPVDTDMWDRLDHGDGFADPALRRFEHLASLPKVTAEQVAAATVTAIEKNRRFVRLPTRFNLYHLLNNAPRRLVEASLAGVRMPLPPAVDPAAESATPFEKLWDTDNPPSRRWPLYTRGNVGEVFPEVVLPLTWGLYGQAAEDGWRHAFETFGLLVPGDMAADEDMVILSVFGGYCYINASFVRLLGVRAPGGRVAAIDQQFFGESEAPAYVERPGDKNTRSTLRLGRTVLQLLRTTSLPALHHDRRTVDAYLSRYPGDHATDDALLDYMVELVPLFQHLFDRHIGNTFSVALLSGALVDLLAKVDMGDRLVSLLGGIGDVESAAPSTAMWHLARSAQALPAVAEQFDAGVSGLLDRLRPLEQAGPWLAEFDAFIGAFGSRGPNEWDLGSDPWEFRPEAALAAIDLMRHAPVDHDPGHQAERLAGERAVAVAEVRAALNRADRFQFDKALAATTLFSQGRERSKTTVIAAIHGARRAQAELARRIADRGGPVERWHTCLLNPDELRRCLTDPASTAGLVAERIVRHGELSSLIPPFIVDGTVPDPSTWESRRSTTATTDAGTVLTGIPGCPGVAKGRARVVVDPSDPGALGPGDVLVAPITDPSWTPLFLAAEAVVVDVGAVMSHAVIVSRELGIPCVVSASGATRSIPDGALLEVDGNTGTVTVLELPDQTPPG
ncbi:MAG: SDR family NAD(P)-dependent oxidoreductase [Acidimicrobiales bacterium]